MLSSTLEGYNVHKHIEGFAKPCNETSGLKHPKFIYPRKMTHCVFLQDGIQGPPEVWEMLASTSTPLIGHTCPGPEIEGLGYPWL